jgi:hypothetical protein
MKPTWRDVLLLVALQFGACVAIALLLALLRINDGSNSWVGLVGGIMGAQVFTILRERRRPGLVAAAAHELALQSTGVEVGIAGLLLYLMRAQMKVQMSGSALVLVVGFTMLVNYALTRWGLRMGVRYLARAAAERASEK